MTDLWEALGVLRQRRDWLTERIRAKQRVGWDVTWDVRERDALSRVIAEHELPEAA
jgi:hypothetical protein